LPGYGGAKFPSVAPFFLFFLDFFVEITFAWGINFVDFSLSLDNTRVKISENRTLKRVYRL